MTHEVSLLVGTKPGGSEDGLKGVGTEGITVGRAPGYLGKALISALGLRWRYSQYQGDGEHWLLAVKEADGAME